MKTIAINTAASWLATIRTFVDGDVFRESNIDLNAGDVADRLGYLKAQVDASGKVAANNTWTGTNTFQDDVTVGSLTVTNLHVFDGATTFGPGDEILFEMKPQFLAGFAAETQALSDANTTLTGAQCQLVLRVPQISANRTYTLPTAVPDGTLALISRVRTADAFTVTLSGSSLTLGIIDASAAGWLLAQYIDTSWRLVAWGGTVSSLNTTV